MIDLNDVTEQDFENRLKKSEEPPEIEPKKKSKKRFKKSTIFWVIGLIVILSLVGYVVNEEYIKPKITEYQNQGAIRLYFELGDELSQCNQVPLVLRNNQTVNAILVECLNQGQ